MGPLGGSPPPCISLTPSTPPTPYPHPLLPGSPLLPFTPSAPGLPGIPGGPVQQMPRWHEGWALWIFRHHSPCPAQHRGPHLLVQGNQCCQAHPWHLGILLRQESREDPSLQVVLQVTTARLGMVAREPGCPPINTPLFSAVARVLPTTVYLPWAALIISL